MYQGNCCMYCSTTIDIWLEMSLRSVPYVQPVIIVGTRCCLWCDVGVWCRYSQLSWISIYIISYWNWSLQYICRRRGHDLCTLVDWPNPRPGVDCCNNSSRKRIVQRCDTSNVPGSIKCARCDKKRWKTTTVEFSAFREYGLEKWIDPVLITAHRLYFIKSWKMSAVSTTVWMVES